MKQRMGEETELKLIVPQASLAKVRRSKVIGRKQTAAPSATDVTSVYYDTRQHDLLKRGITFRVRQKGDEHLQTVKADVNAYPGRKEWESRIEDNKPDFAAVKGTALEPLLDKTSPRRLKPLFATRVRRTVIPLKWGGSEVELAVDRGQVKAGRSRVPVSEVELELKNGDAADLFSAARALGKIAPVRLGMLSKAEVGYGLADNETARPFKSTPIVLDCKLSTADAFRTVSYACLRQVVANEAAVNARHPEGVHQMRVGLRRLRAALAFFSDLTDKDSHVERVKNDLKWITDELGPGRELDVYLSKSVAPLMKQPSPGVRSLARVTERRRKAAFARARDAVRSDRYRASILDVAAWLNAGAWVTTGGKIAPALRERPIVDFATDELHRRWRKIAKKKKKFDQFDTRQRHKLRINAKKLRYYTEFFATLFPRGKSTKRCRKLAKALKRLQSNLGDLNDFAAHGKLTKELVFPRRTRSKHPRQKAFAAGLVAGKERSESRSLLKEARSALRDVAKAKTYWP